MTKKTLFFKGFHAFQKQLCVEYKRNKSRSRIYLEASRKRKKNEKKESTFKHYSREIVLNVAVTAEGKALSGMAMVPSTLGMKYMVNSDISVIGKKEKIAEPRAQATCKTWPWVT